MKPAPALSRDCGPPILGAASLGNIGNEFPEDHSNRDRRSLEFLSEISEAIKGRWQLLNVDTVIVIESVRLAGFVRSMTENVAEALGVGSEFVNIKPKSGNGSSPGPCSRSMQSVF